MLSDAKFTLYGSNSAREIIKVQYSGAWQLVDNGYLPWATAILPMKYPVSEEDECFSRWVESMRKNVECAFGILKRRFTILSVSNPLQSIQAFDQIWLTCCALHNWLLKIDGLDAERTGTGYGDDENVAVPSPLQRLGLSLCVRDSDSGTIDEGPTAGTQSTTGTFEIDQDGVNVARLLSQTAFRAKLVTHLNIAWAKKELKWPVKKTENHNLH